MIVDSIINNYLNITSLLVLLHIFNINKYKIIILLLIDILLNKIPYVSIFILVLYYLNKLIFKKLVDNRLNKCIFITIYLILFITFISIINNSSFYNNIISIIFNLLIYYIYIFYKY